MDGGTPQSAPRAVPPQPRPTLGPRGRADGALQRSANMDKRTRQSLRKSWFGVRTVMITNGEMSAPQLPYHRRVTAQTRRITELCRAPVRTRNRTHASGHPCGLGTGRSKPAVNHGLVTVASGAARSECTLRRRRAAPPTRGRHGASTVPRCRPGRTCVARQRPASGVITNSRPVRPASSEVTMPATPVPVETQERSPDPRRGAAMEATPCESIPGRRSSSELNLGLWTRRRAH